MKKGLAGFYACVLGIAACGGSGGVDNDGGVAGSSGSGGSSSTPVTIGLPRDKPLSSLTAAEAISACERLRMSAENAVSEEDLARYTCTLTAIVFARIFNSDGTSTVDRVMCEQALNECIAESDEQGDSSSSGMCDASFMSDFMSCSATAGELEACLNASLQLLRTQLSMVSCSTNLSSGGSGASVNVPEPPACVSLEMKCPGVLDALDEDMVSAGGDGDGEPPGPGGCTDTCSDANDGFCDDGGDGFDPWCDYGTDCADCGPRPMR